MSFMLRQAQHERNINRLHRSPCLWPGGSLSKGDADFLRDHHKLDFHLKRVGAENGNLLVTSSLIYKQTSLGMPIYKPPLAQADMVALSVLPVPCP